MTPRIALRALSIALVSAAFPAQAADIVLAPPATGGVSVTNAAGNSIRFRVGEDGIVTLPGLAAVPVPSTGLCVEIATGRVGTCAMGGGGGTVTAVTASAPLASSGGATPNISLTGSIPVASGGTGATSLATNGILYGQGTGAVATTVGAAGQVLTGTAGAPAWTGSPSISGNLTLVNSTLTTGHIMKGADRFIHNFGNSNTFIGVNAGNFTMTGEGNTATGHSALSSNTVGSFNTATGNLALVANTDSFNTATGYSALASNTDGNGNSASGGDALSANTIGNNNTASGYLALSGNTTGDSNTAVGQAALFSNTIGSSNIAVGTYAASNLSTGSFNIAIGNAGVAAENGTIRIGTSGNHTRAFVAGIRGSTTGMANAVPVLVDSVGQLGTVSSSRRFKDDIADMSDASAALMKLRPVTFHYKGDTNAEARRLQYGLVAEEVAEVYPGLVAHSADGEIETVMYQYLPTMLLNEYQKQQGTIEAQAKRIAELEEKMERLVKALAGSNWAPAYAGVTRGAAGATRQ